MTSTKYLLAIVLVLSPGEARADDDHEHNYVVGERAVGLGGAFTALADDSSATYYNPAGLAETDFSSFSLTAAVYGFASQRDTLLPGGRSADDSTFITYPSTAAWIQKVSNGDKTGAGRFQLAAAVLNPRNNVARRRLALALPARIGERPRELQQSDLLEVRLFEDEELWAGLSAAYKPFPWLSLGASLFGTLRSGLYQLYVLDLVETSLDGVPIDRKILPDRAQLAFGGFGLIGIFGAMLPLHDHLRLGLSFRTPFLGLSSSAKLNAITVSTTEGETGVASADEPLIFHQRRPWKATLGIAFNFPREATISADVSINGPLARFAQLELEDGTPLFRTEKRATVQAAFGGELYLNRYFPVRFGFFTNRTQLAACDPREEGCDDLANPFSDPADRYGVAGSIAYEAENASLTIGATYNFGAAKQQLSVAQALQSEVQYLFVMIGGSAHF